MPGSLSNVKGWLASGEFAYLLSLQNLAEKTDAALQ